MQPPGNIRVGELEVRPHERELMARGRPVPVTSREFDILMMLAEHPGWVFSADQLADGAGRGEFSPESVSVLVSRLRQKLAEAGEDDAIDTVRGLGYRMHAEATVSDEFESGVSRELRDAWWQLQETVIEAGHTGTPEQQREASEVLERARREIYSDLAERG